MAGPGQKVVLITGCSSGIGLRMAVMLARDERQRYHGEYTSWVRVRACARVRLGHFSEHVHKEMAKTKLLYKQS